MAELIKVRRKGQITLPFSVRKSLGIEEGSYLDVLVKDGEAILRVKQVIDQKQAYFWTTRWLEGEKEADSDIAAGRLHNFSTAEKAIDFLHRKSVKKPDKQLKTKG